MLQRVRTKKIRQIPVCSILGEGVTTSGLCVVRCAAQVGRGVVRFAHVFAVNMKRKYSAC